MFAAPTGVGARERCTRTRRRPPGGARPRRAVGRARASLVAPLPLLGLSFAFEGEQQIGAALAGIDVAGVAALLFVALVSGLFGFAAWTTLIARHTAAAVTPFALLVPVFGIASAALLLGERPSALELGGAVLICAGLAATLLRPRRRGATAAAVAPAAA